MLGGQVRHDGPALVDGKVSLLVGGDVVVRVHLEVLGGAAAALEGVRLDQLVGNIQGIQCQKDIPI